MLEERIRQNENGTLTLLHSRIAHGIYTEADTHADTGGTCLHCLPSPELVHLSYYLCRRPLSYTCPILYGDMNMYFCVPVFALNRTGSIHLN